MLFDPSDGEAETVAAFSMSWRLYNLTIVDNPEAATGSVEELTLAVKANETLDTWNMTSLHVPARFLDYGLYKAVFKLEVRDISLPPRHLRELPNMMSTSEGEGDYGKGGIARNVA